MPSDFIQSTVKPPFANYDVVVYFGGGIFFLPFIERYFLDPFKADLPRFFNIKDAGFIETSVSSLVALFSLYVIGHILAYVSSQIIEKTTDKCFGKSSSAIIVSTRTSSIKRNEAIRALVWRNIKKLFVKNSKITSFVRILINIPVLPIFIITFAFGFFGYYESRVPRKTLQAANKIISNIGLGKIDISIDSKWFKIIESDVINNYPIATARMYNYLVISGLFRTLSIVFLIAIWIEFYYMVHLYYDNHLVIGKLIYNNRIFGFVVYYLFFTFCFYSFMKFKRRYAEEAIFAFVSNERSRKILSENP